MSTIMNALLPRSDLPEARELNINTVYVGGRTKSEKNTAADLCTRIGKMFCIVAEETASALLDARYKCFDPIVKNFGCQINAAEVNQLIRSKREALCEEAVRVQAFVGVELAKKTRKLAGETTLSEYLSKADIAVSDEMARLLRARLLCIVNRDMPKNGRAVPTTEVGLLYKKVSPKKEPSAKVRTCIQLIVDGLQAEESRKAVTYVRSCAERLPDDMRKQMLIRALLEDRTSKVKANLQLNSPIVSVPLLHNTESCLRSYNGILCVKNKLMFCDEPIVGAVAKKVFIKMPEEQLIDVSLCNPAMPVIVVEGYVKPETDLGNRLMAVGVMNMVLANCAPIKQYASGALQDPLSDQEAEQDVIRYKGPDFNDARAVMELDHIFCSSIKEERDEAT
ncbi:MAG: hypothetical protein JSS12_09555 [Verrucomicrobia bacterium]|nr:hypothetical protein [Verrucomicrobiota bacterium]